MNIILSGFKSCGKSTISRELSKRFNYIPIDIDNVILESAHCNSIGELYKSVGNEKFRLLEQNAVHYIQDIITDSEANIQSTAHPSYVIALGGGTIINPLNHQILKQIGRIYFLDVDKSELLSRISKLQQMPELFKNKGVKSVHDPLFHRVFDDYFNSRYDIYHKTADIVLDVNNKNIDQVIDLIIDNVN